MILLQETGFKFPTISLRMRMHAQVLAHAQTFFRGVCHMFLPQSVIAHAQKAKFIPSTRD